MKIGTSHRVRQGIDEWCSLSTPCRARGLLMSRSQSRPVEYIIIELVIAYTLFITMKLLNVIDWSWWLVLLMPSICVIVSIIASEILSWTIRKFL